MSLLRIPYAWLAPAVVLASIVGVYSVNASAVEIWLMIAFGLIGYVLRKFRFDVAPLLLAVVLGDRMELAFRRSLTISDGDYSISSRARLARLPRRGGVARWFAGHSVVSRVPPQVHWRTAMSHDPVRLELVKNAIGSVVDEMVLTFVRIAYSSIMKDTMDLSSAFCDRHGRMIAQGLSLPLHLGSIPTRWRRSSRSGGDDVAPGDVIILNDPYEAGGMHLPDIFMFMPVFVDRHLLGYAVLVAHYNDMGGRVPGSSAADSTEIYQEGLRIQSSSSSIGACATRPCSG